MYKSFRRISYRSNKDTVNALLAIFMVTSQGISNQPLTKGLLRQRSDVILLGNWKSLLANVLLFCWFQVEKLEWRTCQMDCWVHESNSEFRFLVAASKFGKNGILALQT